MERKKKIESERGERDKMRTRERHEILKEKYAV